MSIFWFGELGTLFSNQSTALWERLGYAGESIKSSGVLGRGRCINQVENQLLWKFVGSVLVIVSAATAYIFNTWS